MANKRTTKRALLLSLLSMLLCVSMLVGTTFAWFTDNVSSVNNIIKSGNLDIELEYWNGTAWADVSGKADILTNDLFEPGVTEVAYLRVANAGTLALKYQLGINVVDETAGKNAAGNEFKLSDYIQFGVVENVNGEAGAYTDRQDAVAAVTDAKKISAGYTKAASMTAGEELYLALVVYMPESVDNVANHDGVNVPEIDLGINVFATQYTYEEDSFGDRYDAAAPWVGGIDTTWYDPAKTEYVIDSAEQLAGLAAIVNGTAVADTTTYAAAVPATIQDTFLGKTVKLSNDVDLRNIPWTPIGRIGVSSTDFDYSFKGTFDGQGHTVSNLKVSNTGWAGLFGIAYKATIQNVKVSGATIESNRMAGAIVGQLYGSIDNCHEADADITVTPNAVKDGYDNGDKVGGIVGWLGDNNNNHTLKNSSATDVSITAYRDIGAIAGYVAWSTTISGCKVEKATLTSDQTVGYYGQKDANVNAIWGRNSVSGTGVGVIAENNTETDVTILVKKAVGDAAELKEALETGGEWYLANDIVLDADDTIMAPAGKTTVLNLNGKTVAATSDAVGSNRNVFDVRGTLTVKNGTITYLHTGANMGWNNSTNVFNVTAGGVLKIVDATVENLGGSDMAFCVHLNNWGEVTLNVEDSTVKSTYCPIRVFNSGYDMNNVTIKDSTIYSKGNRAFWVHNYIGDLDSSKHTDDAINARLNFDIFGNGNTYVAETNTNGGVIRYGFGETVYFNAEGLRVVPAPISVPVAPLEEDFLFPKGTDAVLYKDMVLTGDAQIVHAENAVLGLSGVQATLDHDVIVRKSGGAICISDCNFTLTDGAKLITVGEGGDAYQVFLVNVTVNGELLNDTNAGQYLEGISWFGAYPEWPN